MGFLGILNSLFMMPTLHDLHDGGGLTMFGLSVFAGKRISTTRKGVLSTDVSQCCWLGTMSCYGHHDEECSSSSDHGVGDLDVSGTVGN